MSSADELERKDREDRERAARAAAAQGVAPAVVEPRLGVAAPAASPTDSAAALAARANAAAATARLLDRIYDHQQQRGVKLSPATQSAEKQAALLEAFGVSRGANGQVNVNPQAQPEYIGTSVYVAVLAATANGAPLIHVNSGSPVELGYMLIALLAQNVALPAQELTWVAEQLTSNRAMLDPKIEQELDTIIGLSQINAQLVANNPSMSKEDRRVALQAQANRLAPLNASADRVLKAADASMASLTAPQPAANFSASVNDGPAAVAVTKVEAQPFVASAEAESVLQPDDLSINTDGKGPDGQQPETKAEAAVVSTPEPSVIAASEVQAAVVQPTASESVVQAGSEQPKKAVEDKKA